jgi:hypothetical protein
MSDCSNCQVTGLADGADTDSPIPNLNSLTPRPLYHPGALKAVPNGTAQSDPERNRTRLFAPAV